GEIDRNISGVQRVVKERMVLALVEILVRLVVEFEIPIILMAEQDARLRHDSGPLEYGSQPLHLLADLANLLVSSVLGPAIVREHAAVEFLRANARLAPEEKKHPARPARNELISKQAHHARPHQRVNLLPVHIAGLLLNHPEAGIVIRRFD